MEATTTRKKNLAFKVALWSAPFLLLLLLGATWAGWQVAESARAGTLDLSLGGFFVKVDRTGPAQAPRRLSMGFRYGTSAPSRASAKPTNVAL